MPVQHLRNRIRRFGSDTSGATAAYVGVGILALIGVGGLALDLSKFATLETELQHGAGAAALAGAAELDGQVPPTVTRDAITRATAAAQGAFVTNTQTFATGSDNVTFSGVRFFSQLDPDTVTTDPAAARFIEVTASQRTVSNPFIRAVGGPGEASTNAVAVAGFVQAICRMPPLMICNPAESPSGGGTFNADDYRGINIVLKTKGEGAAWRPGDFGLLEARTGPGARHYREEVARTVPEGCYGSTANIRPGEMNSLGQGLNVRFDMFDASFNSQKNNPIYKPAGNVTKGAVRSGGNLDFDSATAQELPRDICLAAGTCSTPVPDRIGDGNWDRAMYWAINHPGVVPPSLSLTGATRYEVYRYEIENPDNLTPTPTAPSGNVLPNSVITNNSAVPAPLTGENGRPVEYTGGDGTVTAGCPNMFNAQCPDNLADMDRRVLITAVVNCIEHDVRGSADNVPVVDFMQVFLVEPYRSGPVQDISVEVIGSIQGSGTGNPFEGLARDIVQLYR